MFTGLVHSVGTLSQRSPTASGIRIAVDCGAFALTARCGDSIAVHGVCLTVAQSQAERLSFDVVPQTLSMTTIGAMVVGDRVNLEPAMRMGDLMGGHIVQGHVDGVGEVIAVDRTAGQWRIRVHATNEILAIVVPQGSITLDGVSLTVADSARESFAVALIPETLARTTLATITQGARVNIEVDSVAKLIDQAVRRRLDARSF